MISSQPEEAYKYLHQIFHAIDQWLVYNDKDEVEIDWNIQNDVMDDILRSAFEDPSFAAQSIAVLLTTLCVYVNEFCLHAELDPKEMIFNKYIYLLNDSENLEK